MTEYVWCMDTRNRIMQPDAYDTDNPTNDVKIRPQLSVNRMTVTAMELATLELPRVQRLIESAWSRLYFYTGFPLFPPAGQTIRIKDCCYEYEAKIPYVLNRVISLDDSDPTTPIFETKTPHLLSECVEFWDFGDPVQVIGLPIPVILPTGSSFTVLSPTRFEVSGFDPGTVWVPNIQTDNFGELYFPQLPSPADIARLVTKGLNQSFRMRTSIKPSCAVFSMEYDKLKSRFVLSVTAAAARTKDIDFIREAVLLVEDSCSLASLLGFNKCNHPFCTQPKKFDICAALAPYGTTFLEVSPGTYLSGQLANVLGQACNADYLPPTPVTLTKSTDIPPDTYVLSIGTDTGSVVQINVPAGGYTPLTLSETVTDLLTVAWPEGEVRLSWDQKELSFIFVSETELPFSLEFQNAALTNISTKLGFHMFRYSGQIQYESDEPVNATPLECPCNLPIRYNNTICNVIDNPNARKMTLNFGSVPPLPITGTTLAVEGPVYNEVLRITNQQQAHGLQLNDVVTLGITGKVFQFPVVSVENGTEVFVSLGAVMGSTLLTDNTIPTATKTITDITGQTLISINSGSAEHDFAVGATLVLACEGITYVGVITAVTPTDTEIDLSPNLLPLTCFGSVTPVKSISLTGPVTVRNSQPPTISLLMSGNNPCSIKPLILGFGKQDVLWEGTDVFESPYVYRLQASTYILLEMIYPVGSARIEHRFGDDNRTTILGKIVTLTDPFLDRFYPMKATFFTGIKLEYCHFRLLNPDHTLYELHGHNWQATFRLYTPQSIQ